jgi:hypothetical protein
VTQVVAETGVHRPASLHDDPIAGSRRLLNIRSFSDAVFRVVANFFAGDNGRFVSEAEAIER